MTDGLPRPNYRQQLLSIKGSMRTNNHLAAIFSGLSQLDEWWGAGVVICLERGAHLHFHCHSLSLASVKSRLVLSFQYRLTRVVPEKGPLNGCVCITVRQLMPRPSRKVYRLLACQWRYTDQTPFLTPRKVSRS